MTENILIHHGVKGQKWGVRRYQNYDGTLTSAGKKHAGNGKEPTPEAKQRMRKENGAVSVYSNGEAYYDRIKRHDYTDDEGNTLSEYEYPMSKKETAYRSTVIDKRKKIALGAFAASGALAAVGGYVIGSKLGYDGAQVGKAAVAVGLALGSIGGQKIINRPIYIPPEYE